MKKLFVAILLFSSSLIFAQQAVITTTKEKLGVFTASAGSVQMGNQLDLYRESNGKMYKIGQAEIVKITGDKVAVQLINAIATDHIAVGDKVDLSSVNAEAAILNDIQTDASPTSSIDKKNKLESWYTLWGLGYAAMAYRDDIQAVLEFIDDLPGVSRSSVALDFLGFYWPLNEHAILGGVINGCADRYEVSGASFQINAYTYSVSLLHFLGNRIGKGFFLRGDMGAARLLLDIADYGTEASKWGFGALAGGGFGIPVSRGTRILLSVNYAHRIIEGDAVGAWQFSVAGLF